jgi:hypothetical protein
VIESGRAAYREETPYPVLEERKPNPPGRLADEGGETRADVDLKIFCEIF